MQNRTSSCGTEMPYHDVQYDAHSPDVVLWDVVGDSLQHLWGRVGGATAERLADETVGLIEKPGESEVRHLDVVACVQQQIFALEISVGRKQACTLQINRVGFCR